MALCLKEVDGNFREFPVGICRIADVLRVVLFVSAGLEIRPESWPRFVGYNHAVTERSKLCRMIEADLFSDIRGKQILYKIYLFLVDVALLRKSIEGYNNVQEYEDKPNVAHKFVGIIAQIREAVIDLSV